MLTKSLCIANILPEVVFSGGFQGVHAGNRLVSTRHHPVDVLLPGAGLGLELNQEPGHSLALYFHNNIFIRDCTLKLTYSFKVTHD